MLWGWMDQRENSVLPIFSRRRSLFGRSRYSAAARSARGEGRNAERQTAEDGTRACSLEPASTEKKFHCAEEKESDHRPKVSPPAGR